MGNGKKGIKASRGISVMNGMEWNEWKMVWGEWGGVLGEGRIYYSQKSNNNNKKKR